MIKEKGRLAAAANVIELYPLGMQKEIARRTREQRKERAKLSFGSFSYTQAEATQGPAEKDIDRGVAHAAAGAQGSISTRPPRGNF